MKKVVRRSVSVLLSVLMVVSMFTVGIVSAGAADLTKGKYYFDNSKTKWNNVYLVVGKAGYRNCYKLALVEGTTAKYVLDAAGWSGYTEFYFRDTQIASSGNITDDKSGNYTVSITATPAESTRMFVPSGTTGASIPGTWKADSTYKEPGIVGGCPSDVFNGTNIMFYVGIDSSWGSPSGVGVYDTAGAKYITGESVSGVTTIGGTAVRSDSTVYVKVPGGKAYNATNNVSGSWAGVSIGTPVAGGAYKIGGTAVSVPGTTITDITAVGGDSIPEGTASVTLNATTSSPISSIGTALKVQFYDASRNILGEGSVTGTSASVSIDTSKYAAGDTITLKSVLFDGNIYTVGPTKTLTVSAGGVAVPTNLKLERAADGHVVKGTGASSDPFMYYNGKAATLTATATAPEGATLEYAFKDTIAQPSDSDFSENAVKTLSGDTTSVSKKRFVYIRAVMNGEKSDAVSLSYYTQCLAPKAEITSSFPDGVAEKEDFTLNLSLSNVFPRTGYGDAVVTVKEGDTVLGTVTVPQASLAADGTAAAAVTCNLTGFGGHTLTASVTYEGTTSANATVSINVFDPNAKTETVGEQANTTVIYVDLTNISGMFTTIPYLHVWDDSSHVLTSEKDPRTAMTAVPGVPNLYYFQPTAAQEAAIGTNTLHVQLLKTSTWSTAGQKFDITAKSQILINSLTATTMGKVNVDKLTLQSITYSSNMAQNQEYSMAVKAGGGLPSAKSAAGYKLTVTAALKGGTTETIVDNQSFAYSASGSAYSFNWTPAAAGTYTLNYTLSDSAGIDSVSYSKTMEVTGVLPPTITSVTPATGSTFSVGQSFDVTIAADPAPEGVTYYYQFSGTGVKTADQTAGTSNTITVDTTEEMVTGPNSITVQVWAQDDAGNKSSVVEKTIDFTVEYTQTQLDYKGLKEKAGAYSAAITAAMEQYCVPADWTDYQTKLADAQALLTANPNLPAYDVTNGAFAEKLAALTASVQTLAGNASYPTADFYVGSQWYHVSSTTTAWDRADVKITSLPDDYIGPMLLQQIAGAISEVQGAALNAGKTTTLSDGRQIYMYKITGVPVGAQFILSDTAGFTFPAEANALTAAQGKTYYVYHDGTDNAMITIDAMSVESFTADFYEVEQGDPVTLTATDKVLGNGMTTAVGAAITQSFAFEDGTAVALTDGVWDTTGVSPGTYKINVTQTDANGIVVKSGLFVTIKVLAPNVYTAPTAVTAAADAEVYYDGDNIIVTAAASGAAYWLGSETSADAKDYDTLEGATYTYELYNGAEKIDQTTGLAGANVTFTIAGVAEGTEYNLTVKAYPTLSKGSVSKTSDAIVKTVQPLIVWNTTAQAFEVQKNTAAVADVFANNGAYTLSSSGVTATAHGADAMITYKYSVTNKDTSTTETLADNSWTPAAGSYSVTPTAVFTYGGSEYTQELTPVNIIVKANLLADPLLTGKMDGTSFNTNEKGTFDLKNYPADDPAAGVFLFQASAAIAEPADAAADISYSYTLKEDEGEPVAITDADGDDSTLTFNINDKCKMGSLYVLTVSAQVTTSGVTQTTAKTYTFAITDSSKLVTIFFGGPSSWLDKIRYVVYNDADQTKLEGTLIGTFETTDQTAGLTSVNYDIYTIQVPAGQEFRIANNVVFDETRIAEGPGLYMADEGKLYYIYGKDSINYAYEVPATTIQDFKASAVDGTSIAETAELYAPLGGTVTFKNTLSSQYASYKTPVKVDYYIGAQKIASSDDASSTTVTADVALNAASSGIDFEVGGSYPVKAVVTEGNYNITYENVVTLKLTAPTTALFTTYFMLTNEMMNDADNPWTAEGIRWEAINASTGQPETMDMGATPIDIDPDTTVNGIQYNIDGRILKVTYHGNISQIRFFMDGQGTGNETDGFSKLSTRYLDVLSGKMSEKVYYITDYSKYSASPTIANGAEGWYNLKYTATFQYPKETARFYQQGETLTQKELDSANSITKSMELYVSANLTKVYPRVDSRYNEYVWPSAGTGVLLADTATIIPTTVNTKKYSLTLVNTPEEAPGAEVSAGTVNSAIEIRSISSKPIDGSGNVPYYIYQETNKLSAQVEYMYGVHIIAPLTSKDKDGKDCDFVGWYDVNKKQFISYQPRFATIVTNTMKLMPVYSDNTTLNILQPQAVIDDVTYETYVQGSVDMVKMVFATRIIEPDIKDFSNVRLYVQRVVKAAGDTPAESEWSAPVDLTSQLNKDKRVNVVMKGAVYNGGVLDSTKYFMRAYLEFNDAEGNPQRVYSNIEMASPELMASV